MSDSEKTLVEEAQLLFQDQLKRYHGKFKALPLKEREELAGLIAEVFIIGYSKGKEDGKQEMLNFLDS